MRRVRRMGVFKLGPVGALSVAMCSVEQKSCLAREQGRRAAQYEYPQPERSDGWGCAPN